MILQNDPVPQRLLDRFGYPGFKIGADGSFYSRWWYGTLTNEWRKIRAEPKPDRYPMVNARGKILYIHELVLLAF